MKNPLPDRKPGGGGGGGGGGEWGGGGGGGGGGGRGGSVGVGGVNLLGKSEETRWKKKTWDLQLGVTWKENTSSSCSRHGDFCLFLNSIARR